METVTIQPNSDAANDYRGCGEAWVAFRDAEPIAIRYLDRGTANRREFESWKDWRDAALRELTALQPTAIYRGMVSCWEFIPQTGNLLPLERGKTEQPLIADPLNQDRMTDDQKAYYALLTMARASGYSPLVYLVQELGWEPADAKAYLDCHRQNDTP